MTLITVRVTSLDLLEGKKGQCAECPVALAMMRAFSTRNEPRPNQVKAGLNSLRLYWPDDTNVALATPVPVSDFIKNFDGGKEVMVPFTFQVEYAKPEHEKSLVLMLGTALYMVEESVWSQNKPFFVMASNLDDAKETARTILGTSTDHNMKITRLKV